MEIHRELEENELDIDPIGKPAANRQNRRKRQVKTSRFKIRMRFGTCGQFAEEDLAYWRDSDRERPAPPSAVILAGLLCLPASGSALP